MKFKPIVFAAVSIAFLWLMIINWGDFAEEWEDAQSTQKVLSQLDYQQITAIQIELMDGDSACIPTVKLIRDSTAIRVIISTYKKLRRYRLGNGRLTDHWRVHLMFNYKTGALLKSLASQNAYATLVFFPTKEHTAISSLYDLYASKTLGVNLQDIILSSQQAE